MDRNKEWIVITDVRQNKEWIDQLYDDDYDDDDDNDDDDDDEDNQSCVWSNLSNLMSRLQSIP